METTYERLIKWLDKTIPNLKIMFDCEANNEELEAWNMKGKNIVYFKVQYHQDWCISTNEFWIYIEVINENEFKIIGMGDLD